MRLQNPQLSNSIGSVYPSPSVVSKSNSKLLSILQIMLLLAIVGWLAVNLFFTLNPVSAKQIAQDIELLSQNQALLSSQIKTSKNIYVVDDAAGLKSKATTSTKDILDKVQDGDYVIEIGKGELLIFRTKTEDVIYFGESLNIVEEVVERNLTVEIHRQAKREGIISGETKPQIEFITDIAALLRQNGALFANADVGDVVAYYVEEEKIIVYNTAEKEIIGVGNIQISPITE